MVDRQDDKRSQWLPEHVGQVLLAILAALSYSVVWELYGSFYSAFGVNPSTAGVDRSEAIAQAIVSFILLMFGGVLITSIVVMITAARAFVVERSSDKSKFDSMVDSLVVLIEGRWLLASLAPVVVAFFLEQNLPGPVLTRPRMLPSFPQLVALTAWCSAWETWKKNQEGHRRLVLSLASIFALLWGVWALTVTSHSVGGEIANSVKQEGKIPQSPIGMFASAKVPAQCVSIDTLGDLPQIGDKFPPAAVYLGQSDQTILFFDARGRRLFRLSSTALLLTESAASRCAAQ